MMKASVTAALLLSPAAHAQTIGPDMVNSGFGDMARYGTDAAGTTTAYAIGSAACNHGDMPAAVAPSGSTIRPLVAQNLYRYKLDTSGSFARFEQVGQGWVKRVALPLNMMVASCGACQPAGVGFMGVNCADVYSSVYNGNQTLLGPRSYINATTALSSGNPEPVGDPYTRGRIQAPTADLVNQPAGTRFFGETVLLLPDDAQYVRPGQTVALNGLNNATTQEANINGGTSSPTLIGATTYLPALTRWQSIDPAVTIVTVDLDDAPNPSSTFPGTTIRARFYVASRVTDLGGNWRYEYAIYNLNSDRAAGSFIIALPGHVPMTDFTFHHPLSHSGEPYSNAAWTASRNGDTLVLSTQPYAANVNANAVRWGTMYNLGFTTPRTPVSGGAQLGLFKPGAVNSLPVPGLAVPTPAQFCDADFDNDGIWAGDGDIEAFFACLAGNCCLQCGSIDFNGDGDSATDADIESFFRVLAGGSC